MNAYLHKITAVTKVKTQISRGHTIALVIIIHKMTFNDLIFKKRFNELNLVFMTGKTSHSFMSLLCAYKLTSIKTFIVFQSKSQGFETT